MKRKQTKHSKATRATESPAKAGDNKAAPGVICYHFAGDTLRDGRPLPRKGETLHHAGAVVPCKSGLHGSVRAIDALSFAPGTKVARVRLHGEIVPHGNDKHAASDRTMLTDYVEVGPVLVELARIWALRAARVYAAKACDKAGLTDHAAKLRALPDAATPEEIKVAAWDAARDAWDAWAARDAWDASWAARDAWDAARAAARAARAAWDAAWDAARDASWAARAAWDAAWNARAAWDAAWAAEQRQQNTELEAELAKLGI